MLSEKLVRCPDCHEKHHPHEACVPDPQEPLPLWNK
jgi:ribosomal protein L32